MLLRDLNDPHRFRASADNVEFAIDATNTSNLPTLIVGGHSKQLISKQIQGSPFETVKIPLPSGTTVVTMGLTFTNGLPGGPTAFYDIYELLAIGTDVGLSRLLKRSATQGANFAIVIDRV